MLLLFFIGSAYLIPDFLLLCSSLGSMQYPGVKGVAVCWAAPRLSYRETGIAVFLKHRN